MTVELGVVDGRFLVHQVPVEGLTEYLLHGGARPKLLTVKEWEEVCKGLKGEKWYPWDDRLPYQF